LGFKKVLGLEFHKRLGVSLYQYLILGLWIERLWRFGLEDTLSKIQMHGILHHFLSTPPLLCFSCFEHRHNISSSRLREDAGTQIQYTMYDFHLFTLFPLLPLELKLVIWDLALPSSRIKVYEIR
jgi:hypothetical protein